MKEENELHPGTKQDMKRIMEQDVDGTNLESDAYVLDLDDEETIDLDALTQEAVAAVARVESGEIAALELTEVEKLQAEVTELKDRSMRTQADFENFRRRSVRERDEQRRYAAFEVLRDFLPVLDNLDRALSAGGSADDLRVGVEMISKQMLDVLRQQGVEEIPAAGEPFDPTFHEAVARDEDPTVDVPMVKQELQKGFRLESRLLRPAMVRVAMPVADAAKGKSDELEE